MSRVSEERKKLGTPTEDFRLAKLIVAWGANIHGNNVHLWPFVEQARRNRVATALRRCAFVQSSLSVNSLSELAHGRGRSSPSHRPCRHSAFLASTVLSTTGGGTTGFGSTMGLGSGFFCSTGFGGGGGYYGHSRWGYGGGAGIGLGTILLIVLVAWLLGFRL